MTPPDGGWGCSYIPVLTRLSMRQDKAAIARDGLAGDIAGFIGCEEQHQVGDVLRLLQRAHGNLRHEGRGELLDRYARLFREALEQSFKHGRARLPRMHGIAA